MPRAVLFVMYIFIQIGKGLLWLKDQVIMLFLYYVGLAVPAIVTRFRESPEDAMRKAETAWRKVEDEGQFD